MRSRRRIGSALALLALTASCGGSGGGGDLGPEDFAGLHRVFIFEGTVASWGTATADGSSAVDFQIEPNDNGIVGAPLSLSLDYSVAPDGEITMTFESAVFEGHVGEATRTTVVGLTAGEPGQDGPAVLFLARPPTTTLSDASLVGTYHAVFLRFDGDMIGSTRDLTFDGSGGIVLGNGAQNTEGAIALFLPGSPASYTVAPDGTFTVTIGGETFEGTVVEGGELVVAAGGNASGDPPGIAAFVKAATAASLSTFEGDYGAVSFEFDSTNISFTGLATADGDGGVSRQGTTNTDGTSAPSSATGTYTVDADGRLLLTDSVTGDVLRGGVAPSGRYAILGGGTSAGSRPTFQILIRK